MNSAPQQQKHGVAVHPRTGKPIKVMTLETQLHADQRTLAWVSSEAEVAQLKGRWKSVSVGTSDIGASYRVSAGSLWIHGQELALTGLAETYPFLAKEWDGTDEDAVLILAAILRFQRIAGFPLGPSGPAAGRADLLRALGVEFLEPAAQPEPVWLIQQYYKPQKERRAREIRKSLLMNVGQQWIDRIVLLNETSMAQELPASDRLHEVVIGHRLTYRDVLEYIHAHVPTGVRVIFSNSDIWLDGPSWVPTFWNLDMHEKFLALLRYESGSGKLFGPRADSQDCWAVLSDSVKRRTWDWAALDFPFGKMGCDNSITTEFVRQKFRVANPCLSLRTIHEHESQLRTYEKTDIVEKQIFMYVSPSGIHDMEPITDLAPFAGPALEQDAFERRLRSTNEAGLKTWVSMVNRQEGQAWSVESQNTWKDPRECDYKMANTFVTNTGLLYDYDRIYVGGAQAAWASQEIHPLTPLTECETVLAVPFDGTRQLGDYTRGGFMRYLARILHLRSKGAEGDFWVGGEEGVKWLRLFEWGQQNVPVIAWEQEGALWSKQVWWTGWRPATAPLYKRDVEALRGVLRGWKKVAGSRRVAWGATPWLEAEEWRGIPIGDEAEVEWIHGTTHTAEEIREALVGAGEILMRSTDACPFLWMLPLGAKVIEVQNEMEPAWQGVHEAGAAGLEHWFVFEPRAQTAAAAKAVVEGIRQTRAAFSKKTVVTASEANQLPLLIVPYVGTGGFYGHSGDTFRELAQLWADAGYVKLVRDSRATLCWLGAIGDTLLYDRPTLEWLDRATLTEKGWRVGLFGNPAPPTGGKTWTFWGRRPALLEGRKMLAWEERTRGLVFYGKCENAVQAERRKGDWEGLCNEYAMSSPEQEYALPQEAYLNRLAEARWGLCLPGYGWKCNREIECMALGVVPVCAPGVDMTNYAEPPVEGLHYLRVEPGSSWVEPERATWERMSAACRAWWERNCSVAGSWEITRRLAGI